MALSNEDLFEAFNSAGNQYGPWSDAEWGIALQAVARAVAADCANIAHANAPMLPSRGIGGQMIGDHSFDQRARDAIRAAYGVSE